MTADHLTLGFAGEEAAANVLRSLGMEIIERNFRCRLGEVDIICRQGDTLVFVEVKTRGRGSLAAGTDAVDRGKRSRLARAASEYLSAKELWDKPCRFDVVCVVKRGDELFVEHLPDAFRVGFEGRGWQPW